MKDDIPNVLFLLSNSDIKRPSLLYGFDIKTIGILLIDAFISIILMYVFLPLAIFFALIFVFIIVSIKFNLPEKFDRIYKAKMFNNSVFSTQFFTKIMQGYNTYVLNTADEKVVVLSVQVNSFFDKTEEMRNSILFQFNSLLINSSNTVPKIIFRSIRKQIDLSQYFYNYDVKKTDIIMSDYYNVFTKEYLDLSKNIQNQEDYIELHFPKNYNFNLIKQRVTLFRTILSSIPNIVSFRELSKNEIYSYYKGLMSGSETGKDLPIITLESD
jgi:hypothetical protein